MGGIVSPATIDKYAGVKIILDDAATSTLNLHERDISLYRAIIDATDSIGNYVAASFIKSVVQQILEADLKM
jgi:hypothetical protein